MKFTRGSDWNISFSTITQPWVGSMLTSASPCPWDYTKWNLTVVWEDISLCSPGSERRINWFIFTKNIKTFSSTHKFSPKMEINSLIPKEQILLAWRKGISTWLSPFQKSQSGTKSRTRPLRSTPLGDSIQILFSFLISTIYHKIRNMIHFSHNRLLEVNTAATCMV